MKSTNSLKERTKGICSLLAYAIATTLLTSPLAFAASPSPAGQGAVNTKFKSALDTATACSSDFSSCLEAQSYDDLNGVPQGSIIVYNYSNSYTSIYCSGPAYAGIVSTNPGNGNVSVKATLDPSDPSCGTFNWNGGPVTVNLSGTYPNGGYRSSSNGNGTQYFNGITSKFNNTSNYFDETFTGSITAFPITTPLTGSANAGRITNRQQQ